jgi:hypothetical protein
MKVTIEKGELVVRVPLEEPAPSASGKTLVVASSHGNQTTQAICPKTGRQIIIGFNAYVKP